MPPTVRSRGTAVISVAVGELIHVHGWDALRADTAYLRYLADETAISHDVETPGSDTARQ
jgi:hypothetical protein